MEKLYLTSLNLGDDGLAAIASSVKNIKKLSIEKKYNSQITIKGICALAQEISKRDKPVSYQYSVSVCVTTQMQSLYFSIIEKEVCLILAPDISDKNDAHLSLLISYIQ